MRELPGGVVTFLFSDIEGSTRLVKALRERYAGVLAEHRRLVRTAVAAHAGYEVDTQGDAFFVAFGGAKQAVLCALDIQRALGAQVWPGGARVRVRIGIHTGQPVVAGGGYTGLAVHRAARICAVAAGGQVLISQATQDLIEDEEEAEPGFALVDVGEYRLKDLDRPVRLFQLTAAGLDLPAMAPSSRDAGAGVRGWRPPLTSFVGRDGPIREVAGLLGRHRLVTVTGPGGSGKTRLAGVVAQRAARQFADGAWLAELAATADPALVDSVVAAALGVRELPGVPAAEAVARALAGRQLLLVLDNCEHVVGAAADLCAGLLAAADDVAILATSREPLAIAGEARYRLTPLILPDLNDLAAAARGEAVELFADRARRVDPQFTLDEGTGPEVARLVARLDGMPLAIELAAAQVEALGVAQLLNRLDDRFALLAGGDRTAPSRQRSLAATVQWSYQLLDDGQQQVFRALSVFPGPFTLDAAEAVTGADAAPAVLHLVDCSLLVPPRPGPDGRFRYQMLETLRAYGNRLLAEIGEHDQVAALLAGWALEVAEQAAIALQTNTAEEVAAARWLDAEDATMRQVLAWMMDHDPASAVRLVAALGWWWLLRGRLPGQYGLLRDVAGSAKVGSGGWCAIQLWVIMAALYSADMTGTLDAATALRDATAGRGPSRALADGLAGRAVALLNLGRVGEAAEEARRSLAIARETGHQAGQIRALGQLCFAAASSNDLDGAVQLARQAAQITDGVPGSHVRFSDSALTIALIMAGDMAAADEICAKGLARSRDAGDVLGLWDLLPHMVTLDVHAGRFKDAAAHLREGLEITMRTGGWNTLINCLDRCAYLCAATGRPAEAVTIWAAQEALFGNAQAAEQPAGARQDESLHAARQALGPDRARAAEERGITMSLTTVAEYALMLTAPSPPQPQSLVLANLTAREHELLVLVAQGHTNAQIAALLHLSTSTIRARLNRIRAKTGSHHRADLTRLALQAGLL
jgi:predicted ATPase/class 3 adenylate cyclase/DNA-binding CsgD family transcriptional regulator